MHHRRMLLAFALMVVVAGCAETGPEPVADQEDQAVANCEVAWQERYPAGQIRRVSISGDGGYTYLVEGRG